MSDIKDGNQSAIAPVSRDNTVSYIDAYQETSNWIENSLDMYKVSKINLNIVQNHLIELNFSLSPS